MLQQLESVDRVVSQIECSIIYHEVLIHQNDPLIAYRQKHQCSLLVQDIAIKQTNEKLHILDFYLQTLSFTRYNKT